MWAGWMMLAGNEIINTARTEAYARSAGSGWFQACSNCPDLGIALGDGEYTSPLIDEAPWFDADEPDTWRFWGFYPLSITGAEDSVRQAPVTEALNEGGVVGPLRQATRSITVAGMCVGADECAVAAGTSWLRWACLGSNCRENPECTGDDLCFLACCPDIDPCTTADDGTTIIPNPAYPLNCLDDYIRKFRLATVTEGPSVTAKHEMSDGGVAWEITMTIVCAVPWSYGNTIHIYDAQPFPRPPLLVQNEPACPDDTPPDHSDPWCAKVPVAPTVPQVPLACYTLPTQWDRYVFPLPMESIRTWQDSVPTITIKTGQGDGIHNIRLRFYADPLSREDIAAVNTCDFCGEFYITYIPPVASFTVDGQIETITVEQLSAQGKKVIKNAEAMVMSTDGGPFVWPLITCGYAYMLTVDMTHQDGPPAWLTVEMTPRGV